MPETIFALLSILAVLQGLSILLNHLGTAAHQIEGRSSWVGRDGTAYEEFAVPELEGSRVMQRDFDETRSEAIFFGPIHPVR